MPVVESYANESLFQNHTSISKCLLKTNAKFLTQSTALRKISWHQFHLFLTEELLLTLITVITKTNAQKPPSVSLKTPHLGQESGYNPLKIHYQYTLKLRILIFTRPFASDSRFLSILLVFAIRQRRSCARRCVGTFIGHFEGEARPICAVNGGQSRKESQSNKCVFELYTFLRK